MRRVVLAAAGCVALALTLYPFTLVRVGASGAALAALTGAAFAGALVWGRRTLGAFAIGLFMIGYAVALVVRGDGIDPLAPLLATACLFVVEAIDLGHAPDVPERAVWGRRTSFMLVALGTSSVVATASLAVAHWVGAGHPGWFVLGATCALGAVGAAVLMARRLLTAP